MAQKQSRPDKMAGSLALKTSALDGGIIVTDTHLLRALRKQGIVIRKEKENKKRNGKQRKHHAETLKRKKIGRRGINLRGLKTYISTICNPTPRYIPSLGIPLHSPKLPESHSICLHVRVDSHSPAPKFPTDAASPLATYIFSFCTWASCKQSIYFLNLIISCRR